MGSGAVLAAAAASAVGLDVFDQSLVDRGLHHVGLSSSPDAHVPASGATERSGFLDSVYMGRQMAWTVSSPVDSGALSGIIVCLHGKGTDHRLAFDTIHVPDVAASVALRVAVAAIDGGADSYWHKRADGTDALSMLLHEFVPFLRHMFGIAPMALMGWSMGGYGSLLAAERDRETFVGVAPTSPALWLTPGATAPGAFDSPADFYANDIFSGIERLRGMAIAVACGTGDPFYNATRHLDAQMDYPHTAIYGSGYHDAAYWRSVAPAQLRALAAALK